MATRAFRLQFLFILRIRQRQGSKRKERRVPGLRRSGPKPLPSRSLLGLPYPARSTANSGEHFARFTGHEFHLRSMHSGELR